ncbi:MAG: winged helix-turn-helix transcriptional regulator [Methanobrevibacter sp.]|jgi:predicted transcriptional regulator|nr:winged helix-turn-helix transcriptional regulator [Candidatus Methanoflexus mossambicus]
MMITLVKKQTGREFINEMEKQYKSIDEAEKILKGNPTNMILYVDLENWKHYLKNPDEKIKRTTSLVTDELILGEIELQLLNTIKRERPRSIRELARMTGKDVSVVQPKIKNLVNNGLIQLKKQYKNSKTPYLNYDQINIAV